MNIDFSSTRKIVGMGADEDYRVSFEGWVTGEVSPRIITSTEFRDATHSYELVGGAGAVNEYTIHNSEDQHVTVRIEGDAFLQGNKVVPYSQAPAFLYFSGRTGNRVYDTGAPSLPVVECQGYMQYLPGTLGAHIVDSIIAMQAGKVASNGTKDRWLTANYSYANPQATSNNECWLSLDTSASSFTRNGTNHRSPLTLISPRHGLTSDHIGMWVGAKVVFRTSAGGFVTRTVVAIERSESRPYEVHLLDADVTGVEPFSVLPSDWDRYLPSLVSDHPRTVWEGQRGMSPGIPVITLDGNDLQGSRDMAEVRFVICAENPRKLAAEGGQVTYGCNHHQYFQHAAHIKPTPIDQGFGGDVIGGDSGSPIFFPINGKLVLLGETGSYNGADWYATAETVAAINAAMNKVSGTPQGTYAMRTVDLSGFMRFE